MAGGFRGLLDFIGYPVGAAPVVGDVWTTRGGPFLYVHANWSNVEFFYEAYFRATSGTVRARLYNLTDSVAVVGSEVSTASATHVRLRSGALVLVDGKEYVAQFGTTAGSAGRFIRASVIAY